MTIQEAIETWNRDYKGQPGKFEGESAATLYYYYAMMDGDGEPVYADDGGRDISDDDDEPLLIADEFETTSEERIAFFLQAFTVRLYHSEQGFETLVEVKP